VDGGDDDAGNVALVAAQHVLILVDCHADMFGQVFQDHDDGDDGENTNTPTTPFDMALRLAQELLQRCIRTSVTLKTGKRNGVGLLLYHTKPNRTKANESDDDEDNNNNTTTGDEQKEESDDDSSIDEDDDDDDEHTTTVHVLLPLAPPGVTQVKTIRRCVSSSKDDDRNLKDEFACPDHQDVGRIAPLQTALEESMRIFRKAKCVKDTTKKTSEATVDSKSIWILTNRDNPYPSLGQLIQNVARDAGEEGIQLQVWPLPSSTTQHDGPSFDHGAFFDNITLRPPTFPERFQSLEELLDGLDDLQDEYTKIRRAFYGPLLLPDWREQAQKEQEAAKTNSDNNNNNNNNNVPPIMIDWFRFVQFAKKPSTVTINQETKR
jgi:hypothetical protein